MHRINRRSLLKSGAAAGSSLLLHNHAHAEPAPAPAGSLILETANRFLAALDNEQRAKATFPFDSDERMNWHFIPKVRKGLPLREMTPYQKHLASALLSAGLSQTGYIKAVIIMSLEDVLKTIENASDEYRNPKNTSSRFSAYRPQPILGATASKAIISARIIRSSRAR